MDTTEHQKWPNMGQNCIISPLFARRANQVRSPPQELEAGPHSGPYLLVYFIMHPGSERAKPGRVLVFYVNFAVHI